MDPIPDIEIRSIYIPSAPNSLLQPSVYTPGAPPVTVQIGVPIIQIPGCVEAHDDNKQSKTLVDNDPEGSKVFCDGQVPSYRAMDYVPEQLIITKEQEAPPVNTDTNTGDLETPQPEIPDIPPDKKEKEEDVPCPGPNDQRIGDLRNAQAKEKVVGHEIKDGKCITLYEETTVVDRYVPTPAQVVNTAQIAVVAATVPLLIAVVKPAVAQLIKRIPKLLGRKSNEVLSLSQRLARQRSLNRDQKLKNQLGQTKRKKMKKK
tara:strand:+ start:527 stop:1306 length:780 start_codon:yes stop_codon:yes gene_type:complete